jgi:hypothetical protein
MRESPDRAEERVLDQIVDVHQRSRSTSHAPVTEPPQRGENPIDEQFQCRLVTAVEPCHEISRGVESRRWL